MSSHFNISLQNNTTAPLAGRSIRPMAHNPSSSSPYKLLVPESRNRNLDNLSCILIPDFVWYLKLGQRTVIVCHGHKSTWTISWITLHGTNKVKIHHYRSC